MRPVEVSPPPKRVAKAGKKGRGESKQHTEPLSERILSAMSAPDFISQYVELDSRGKGYCPFHDDQKKSFQVNAERNFWSCYACHQGGNIIHFWSKWREKEGNGIVYLNRQKGRLQSSEPNQAAVN